MFAAADTTAEAAAVSSAAAGSISSDRNATRAHSATGATGRWYYINLFMMFNRVPDTMPKALGKVKVVSLFT